MEPWRLVFRRGIAPQLSTAGLVALREALRSDSPQLLQGATCSPPNLTACGNWPVEAACPIGYAGWKGDGKETVADVEEEFGRVCNACDLTMQEPAICANFLNAWDDTPRAEMVRLLLPEVEAVLAERELPILHPAQPAG